MAKVLEKQQAMVMRKDGMSIKQIAKRLCISRSTASMWCREILLTQAQQKQLRLQMIQGGNQGRMKGRDANIQKRQNNILVQRKNAQKIVERLSARDISMIGLGLYWGEGSKKNERRFIFTNSDYTIVRCMIRWLLGMGIPRQDIVGQIYINEQHSDRIAKVERYWHIKLNLPLNQLRKSILNKSTRKKFYANREEYYGTFRLMVKKSSRLQYLTLAMISMASEQV